MDVIFLHHQERMLYASSRYAFGDFSNNPDATIKASFSSNPRNFEKTYFMPNQQDKMLNHLRSWIYKKAGGGVKWGAAGALQPFPPRLPRAEIFDSYYAHTKECTKCSKSLKNTVLLRNMSMVLAIASLTLLGNASVWMRIAAFALFSTVATTLEGLRNLFYKYEFCHQDND